MTLALLLSALLWVCKKKSKQNQKDLDALEARAKFHRTILSTMMVLFRVCDGVCATLSQDAVLNSSAEIARCYSPYDRALC